jgi:hypothetical protein
MISWIPNSPMAIEALYRVFCFHESAHMVLYKRFGVESDVSFEFSAAGDPVGAGVVPRCSVHRAGNACAAWAGLMGEWISGHVLQRVEGAPPLTIVTLNEWAAAVYPTLNKADRALTLFDPDPTITRRFTLDTLLSPVGNHFLYQEAERLVDIMRQEHAKALGTAGRKFVPGSREMAAKIFSGLAAF